MMSLADLTEIDKCLLTRSWNLVSKNMETMAVDIFEMIFEQAPDAKLMFTFMMRDNTDDEKKSSEFAFHALRFMQVIESTMEHLEDPQTLDPLLANVGKIHARHEERLGFRFAPAFSFSFPLFFQF
ncbi:globin, partial [Cooperia oncophora]